MSDIGNFRHPEFTNGDSPIHELSEDVLNRGRFAISLAHLIHDWHDESGLVIGLHGVWGSGKTSVKNLIVGLLKNRNPPLTVIEFNPWSWSGEEKLSVAFFEEIGNSIEASPGLASKRTLASTWRKYSARLTLGSSALKGLVLATEAAGVPWATLLLRGLAGAADQSASITSQAADAATDSLGQPLSEIHQQLREQLSKLNQPILVVLDDIDRLSRKEISILFRIVKANANFPNLVFLTLYDRAIVEKALDDYTGSSGAEFLKKVVQVTFDLPTVDRMDLDTVLTDQLKLVLAKMPQNVEFDTDRFQKTYNEGLAPYFSTLRDIKRFFSSFSLHVAMFFNQGEFEASIVDLLCLETLRVFEPQAYRHLELHHECVFSQGLTFKKKQEQQDEQRGQIQALLDVANQPDAAHAILASVFPQIGWLRDGFQHGIGFEDRWAKERRACHGDHFDRYFRFTVERQETSSAFLNKLFLAAAHSDQFCDLLLSLKEPSTITRAMRRFEIDVDDLPESSINSVIHGLFRLGDELPHHQMGMSPSSPDLIAWRIVNRLYLRIQNPVERANSFCLQLEKTPYLWFPCRITALEEPDKGEQLSSRKDILTHEAVSRVTAICARKIEEAAAKNQIDDSRMMFYLYRWRDWAGKDPVKAWVAQYVETPKQAINFLRQITREVSSSRGVRFEPDMKGVEDFIDPEILREKVGLFLHGDKVDDLEPAANDTDLRSIWNDAFAHYGSDV